MHVAGTNAYRSAVPHKRGKNGDCPQFTLCEALEIKIERDAYPKLKEIRDVRHDTVGHPTKRKGQPISYNHISQMTLNHCGFDMMTFFADGSPSVSKKIDIPALIAEQRMFISTILDTLISNLDAEEKAHKEEFRMEKLTDCFPGTLGYCFEKIFEGIHRPDYPVAAGCLEEVKTVIQRFREAVGRRNMDFHDSLQDEYDLMEYAIDYLDKHFGAKTSTEALAARIFTTFLKGQVEELREYAQEVDNDYAE